MGEYICPHCKKPINDEDALLCLFCGKSLNRPNKYFMPHALVIVIIIILLIGFTLIMMR